MGTLSGEATLPFYFFHFFSMETNSSWKECVLEQILSVKRRALFGKPFLFKEANRKSFKFSPFETIVGQKNVAYLNIWRTHSRGQSLNHYMYKTWLVTPYYFCKNCCIHSVIRQVFPSLEWLQITKSVHWNFAVIPVLPFLNNPKYLDRSFKMALDFRNYLKWKKNLCLITKEIWNGWIIIINHYYYYTLMCLSIGTPKNNKFSICSKWKIHYF